MSTWAISATANTRACGRSHVLCLHERVYIDLTPSSPCDRAPEIR